MNELIKQLAEQATTEEHDGFRYLDKRKFAELIVKEVTNIMLHYTDVDEGARVAKMHFGVEE